MNVRLDTGGSAKPLLTLRGISKSFNGVDSLKSVDLDLYPGEILGLVGDNGAGKSTLIKTIAGAHKPDAGEILIHGKQVDFSCYNVHRARLAGIETVYQEGSFGWKQPLWRNVFMGRSLTNRFGFIKVKEQKRITLDIMKKHIGLRGSGVSSDAELINLSGGERQGLAIGRAMHFGADIIVLDEPTTALSLKEVDKVLSFVQSISNTSKGCIYISHNMNHVAQLVDRIVVLDRGRVVDNFRTSGASVSTISKRILEGIGSADECLN